MQYTVNAFTGELDAVGTGGGGGGGTVTQVNTGTGLTGGPITTTGTVSLANINNLNVLSNISGISAPPIPNSMSNILDATLGSTQGDILYRGASAWSVLAPGTNGNFLQTQGAAANPQWASVSTPTLVAAARVFWVASNGNDTTGDGSLANPFQTYNKAWFQAALNGASSSNPYQIVMCPGVYTINGDFNIGAWISVAGLSKNSVQFNIVGTMQIDGTWSVSTTPKATLSNLSFNIDGDVNITFTGFQIETALTFDTIDFEGTGAINITGTGTTASERVLFLDCQNVNGIPPDLILTDMDSFIISSDFQNVSHINTNANYSTNMFLNSSFGPTLMTLTASSSSAAILSSSATPIGNIVITGANTLWISDASSYCDVPTFAGGATISGNVAPLSLADGVKQSTFTPAAYTPTASSTWLVDSVTGNLKGIDLSLVSINSTISTLSPSGTYSPTLTAVTNCGTLSVDKVQYMGAKNTAGSVVMVVLQIQVTPSAISFLFKFDVPVGGLFSASTDAALIGGQIYDTATQLTPGVVRQASGTAGENTITVQGQVQAGVLGTANTLFVTASYIIQ